MLLRIIFGMDFNFVFGRFGIKFEIIFMICFELTGAFLKLAKLCKRALRHMGAWEHGF